MSGWGESGWSEAFWGDTLVIEAVAVERLLYHIRRGENARSLISFAASRIAAFAATADDVASAFDLDTAAGVHLDTLGRLLGQAREGMVDVRYRAALRAQAQAVLSSNASDESIGKIIVAFSGQRAVAVHEWPPLSFTISAVIRATEIGILSRLIRRARAATYYVTLVAEDGDTLYVDTTTSDETDPGTVDTTGEDEGTAAYAVAGMVIA